MKKFLLTLSLFFMVFLLLGCQNQENHPSQTVTVTFSLSLNQDPLIITHIKGEIFLEPVSPTLDGYSFLGWYLNLNDEEPYLFNETITEDLVLYAKWEEDVSMEIDGTKTFSAEHLWAHRNLETTENLQLVEDYMMIDNATLNGVYESKPIAIHTFEQLVLSWNIKDLDKATLTFRVAVGKDDAWSREFVMGSWKKNHPMSAATQEDSFARVHLDTLFNKDTSHDAIILKILIRPNQDDMFKIKNLSVTTKRNTNPLLYNENVLIEKELAVPPVNQLSVPQIGNLICSPTSMTMVMNYYGYQYRPENVASWVKDYSANIYGNWTFTASFAGHEHLFSRVEYIDDINTIVNYIKNDIPVVLSITTQTKEDLPGSLSGYPAGHLIVLTGFTYQDGVWYGIINDPAFYYDEDVRQLYPMDLLLLAFKGYTYIVSEQPLS